MIAIIQRITPCLARLFADVSIAADLDRHAFLAASGGNRSLFDDIRVNIAHIQADDTQMRQRLAQLTVTIFLATAVERDGDMRLIAQNFFYEIGQDVARAKFDEEIAACRVNIFDFLPEMHRI